MYVYIYIHIVLCNISTNKQLEVLATSESGIMYVLYI